MREFYPSSASLNLCKPYSTNFRSLKIAVYVFKQYQLNVQLLGDIGKHIDFLRVDGYICDALSRHVVPRNDGVETIAR